MINLLIQRIIPLARRRIVDTKNQLEKIYAQQRELNHNAAIAEQDRRAAELMAKMAVSFNFKHYIKLFYYIVFIFILFYFA